MTTGYTPPFEIAYEHAIVSIEELQNSNLGYLTVNNSHPWLGSSFQHGGLNDKGDIILSVQYVLDLHIRKVFQQNGIYCHIMRTEKPPCDELILVFDNPDQAVFAALLCDK